MNRGSTVYNLCLFLHLGSSSGNLAMALVMILLSLQAKILI